jgi:hypothetical protein
MTICIYLVSNIDTFNLGQVNKIICKTQSNKQIQFTKKIININLIHIFVILLFLNYFVSKKIIIIIYATAV